MRPTYTQACAGNRGLCECGCGATTTIATAKHLLRGYRIGEPLRFIKGHSFRVMKFAFKGKDASNWIGGRRRTSHGYIAIRQIAERALGKTLPPRSKIHHFNEVKDDNRNTNIVICHNHRYHLLLHIRTRALRATGNPKMRRCVFCKQWADPVELTQLSTRPHYLYHLECERQNQRQRRLVPGRHDHA
jgi:hypothetical protein